jgi:hypothetical protein
VTFIIQWLQERRAKPVCGCDRLPTLVPCKNFSFSEIKQPKIATEIVSMGALEIPLFDQFYLSSHSSANIYIYMVQMKTKALIIRRFFTLLKNLRVSNPVLC